MVKIKEINGVFVHDCVQCGTVVRYRKHDVNKCHSCKIEQRLFNVTRATEVSYEFIAGDVAWIRVWYHLSRTNCS